MRENPGHDTVYALAADEGLCFAARHSGLWMSGDDAQTWQRLPIIATGDDLTTTCLVMSPHFDRDGFIFAGVNGGILRSADRGSTWTTIALPAPPPFITGLAIDPEGEFVFAATLEDGVLRSADSALNWKPWNFGLFDLNVLSIAVSPDFAHDRMVYLGTETGLFRSRNEGRAWQEIEFPERSAPVLCLALSPDFARDGIIFAGTEAAGLFRSENRGESWKKIFDDRAANAVMLSANFSQTRGLALVTPGRLYSSRDAGQSWQGHAETGGEYTGAVTLLNGNTLLLGHLDGSISQTPHFYT